MHGKKKLQSCKPLGPFFWDDVKTLDINDSRSENKEPGKVDQENISLLGSTSEKSSLKAKIEQPVELGIFTYAGFFRSTKTVKKVANAMFDVVLIAILAFYRKWLQKF